MSDRTRVALEYDKAQRTKVREAVEFQRQYAGPQERAEYAVGPSPCPAHTSETEKAS